MKEGNVVKIKHEIDLDITPIQVAELVYEEWCDGEVIEFLNGLGRYRKDMQELLLAASDRTEYLDNNGRWMLNLIKEYLVNK